MKPFIGPNLPGRFISAKKSDDNHVVVFYHDGRKIDIEDITVRFGVWHDAVIKLEEQIGNIKSEDERELKSSVRDLDYLRRGSERQASMQELEREIEVMKKHAFFFQTLLMEFEAGLSLAKYFSVPTSPEGTTSPDTGVQTKLDDELKAILWGVEEYLKRNKPKPYSKIHKSRTIAKEAVDQHFPKLKGKARENKIDALRDRIAT